MINTSLPPAFDLESQKQLARLLAKENIHIRVGNYSTAFFEPKTRVLGLPSWNVSDKNVADLLVGHEVGHALFTPVNGIAEFQSRFPDAPFDVCNIVEDIRIERMILDSYPGLITPFRNGYSYFLEKDFFKIAERDINKMDFLDRLNLKGKLRDLINIEFSIAELSIYKRCLKAETWQDVLNICADIIKMNKKRANNAASPGTKQQDQQKSPQLPSAEQSKHDEVDGDDDTIDLSKQQVPSEDGDSTSEGESKTSSNDDKQTAEDAKENPETASDDESSESEQASSEKYEDSSEQTSSEESEESEESSEKESETKQESSSDEKDESDSKQNQNDTECQNDSNTGEISNFKSETQRAFDSNLNDLHANCDFSSINNPIKSDFEKCIVDINTVREGRKKYLSRYNDIMTCDSFNESWLTFKASSKNIIASYTREFERKKSAYQYSRATQSTTGRINVNKLHAYRYDDQIFKSITNLADAKSHGMVFFLDYSQSMCSVIGSVVKQLLQLVWFCKAVNIPFVVYSFTSPTPDQCVKESDLILRPGENIDFRGANVAEILNSNLSKNEFEMACKEIYFNTVCCNLYNGFRSVYEYMSGTPLFEMIIIGAHLVREFQEKTRVQKVNTIFLTDGDGGPLVVAEAGVDRNFIKSSTPQTSTMKIWKWNKHVYQFTRRESYVSNYTALIKDFKAITRSNVICFFVPTGGKSDMIGKCTNAYITSEAYPAIDNWTKGHEIYANEMKKNKNEKYVYISGGFGFDGYFVMKNTQNMNLEDDSEFVVPSNVKLDSTAGRRNFAKAFTNHTVSKNDSRVFLNKFFDLIA